MLRLSCPHLKRAKSTLRLRVRTVRGGTRVATATVRGKRPRGVIRFTSGRLKAPVLLGRRHSASFVLPSGSSRVKAAYEGDANNRPSRAKAS